MTREFTTIFRNIQIIKCYILSYIGLPPYIFTFVNINVYIFIWYFVIIYINLHQMKLVYEKRFTDNLQ